MDESPPKARISGFGEVSQHGPGVLVHVVQLERGCSCAWVASGGVDFAEVVNVCRGETDKVSTRGSEVSSTLLRTQLPVLRAAADAANEAAAAGAEPAHLASAFYATITGYSALISDLIYDEEQWQKDAPDEATLASALAFVNLKECFGLQRAFVGGVLSLPEAAHAALPARAFADFVISLHRARSEQNAVVASAPPQVHNVLSAGFELSPQLAVYQDGLLRDFDVLALKRAGLTPRKWFDLITAHINKMHGLQLRLATELTRSPDHLHSLSRNASPKASRRDSLVGDAAPQPARRGPASPTASPPPSVAEFVAVPHPALCTAAGSAHLSSSVSSPCKLRPNPRSSRRPSCDAGGSPPLSRIPHPHTSPASERSSGARRPSKESLDSSKESSKESGSVFFEGSVIIPAPAPPTPTDAKPVTVLPVSLRSDAPCWSQNGRFSRRASKEERAPPSIQQQCSSSSSSSPAVPTTAAAAVSAASPTVSTALASKALREGLAASLTQGISLSPEAMLELASLPAEAIKAALLGMPKAEAAAGGGDGGGGGGDDGGGGGTDGEGVAGGGETHGFGAAGGAGQCSTATSLESGGEDGGGGGLDSGSTPRDDDPMSITLDELALKNRIGGGSFGTAYLAVWTPVARGSAPAAPPQTVAVKVASGGHGDSLEQWHSEVKALTGLVHPNIVRYYGFVDSQPIYCLVFQFCNDGERIEDAPPPHPAHAF